MDMLRQRSQQRGPQLPHRKSGIQPAQLIHQSSQMYSINKSEILRPPYEIQEVGWG